MEIDIPDLDDIKFFELRYYWTQRTYEYHITVAGDHFIDFLDKLGVVIPNRDPKKWTKPND